MFKPCNCKTVKGNNCKSNGAFTREHEDHIHNVCDTHNKKEEVVFIDTTCNTARITPDPTKLAEVQQTLPIPNTDGLEHIDNLRKIFGDITIQEKIMDTNIIRIMVTGHTHLVDEAKIEETLTFLLDGYVNTYGKANIVAVSGGALGADKIFARAAYKMGIAFEVYVPNGYEHVFIALNRYNRKDRPSRNIDMDNFYKMLSFASAVYDENGNPRDPNGRYNTGANFVRNTTMVKVSDHHIAVSNHDPREVINNNRLNSGTYHAIREMKRLGINDVVWVPNVANNIKASHIIHINREN